MRVCLASHQAAYDPDFIAGGCMATNAGVTAMWDDRGALGLTNERLLRYEFEVLEEHRRQMDDSLRQALQETERQLIATRKHPPDIQQMLAGAEAVHEAAELLPRLQWNAQLVLAYSTFEHALNRVCALAKARTGSTVDFGRYKGPSGKDTGIFKAKSYLAEIAQITTPFAGAEWDAVVGINKLRNVIAHTSGEFSDPPQARELEVQALVPRWVGVHVVINPNGTPQRFRLTAEFVSAAIAAFSTALALVCQAEPSTLVAMP
jgi:hypothetical protein